MPVSQNDSGAWSALSFPTFMGCKLSRDFDADDVDVVVTGVPFDLAATIRPGARFGPAAIRMATTHLDWELRRWPWQFALCDQLHVVVTPGGPRGLYGAQH